MVDVTGLDAENIEMDNHLSAKVIPTPRAKKRKREQSTTWNTPYRPRNAKRAATTIRTLTSELGIIIYI